MMKNLSMAEIAVPHMRVLVDEIRLPAHLAVPDGDQGVYIQKVDAPGLIKIDTYVGRRMDLHCTGVGKVILAYGPPEMLDRLVQSRLTSATRETRSLRRDDCARTTKIRKLGYAVDDEEEELAVRCIAVPVHHSDGRFAAALSVSWNNGADSADDAKSIMLRRATRNNCAGEYFPRVSAAVSRIAVIHVRNLSDMLDGGQLFGLCRKI